jgi:Ni,Fe-hydrogenase III small subunit
MIAALRRGLAADPAPPSDPEMVVVPGPRRSPASRDTPGRGAKLFLVDGGGCNGCALELRMLNSVVYDLERFGLSFADSPRHADVLLVTGPPSRSMREALLRSYAAMPEPRRVVAIGDCAVDGGVFKGSYAALDGVGTMLPVDLVIRGCPPTPAQILQALRALEPLR